MTGAEFMRNYRKVVSALLMLTGIAILLRGVHYSLTESPGWQNLLLSTVAGALVFALGLARWRYWRQR
jgi:predicted cobalt transporter CbtA